MLWNNLSIPKYIQIYHIQGKTSNSDLVERHIKNVKIYDPIEKVHLKYIIDEFIIQRVGKKDASTMFVFSSASFRLKKHDFLWTSHHKRKRLQNNFRVDCTWCFTMELETWTYLLCSFVKTQLYLNRKAMTFEL